MRKSPLGLVACLLASSLVAQDAEIDHENWDRAQILSALSGLQLSPELECETEAIGSSAWTGLQDSIADLHHGPLSPYDGIVFPNYHYVQIEHIVARKEADESGLCSRGEDAREQFAADLLNLTLAPGSLNASKGDGDAHDIEIAQSSLFRANLTEQGRCWWAAQTIRVKAKYRLRVDTDEKSALGSILENCAEAQVYRPKLLAGSDWVFRTEFLDALSGELSISPCADSITDASRLQAAASATSLHLPSIACVPRESPTSEGEPDPETPTLEPATDPRAEQKAAQNACIQTLESRNLRTNCTNIRGNCPDVDPIMRGEPLYGSLRDTDNDGVVCETL